MATYVVGDPVQVSQKFVDMVHDLKKEGRKEQVIAIMLGFPSTLAFRRAYNDALNVVFNDELSRVRPLHEQGKTIAEISEELGISLGKTHMYIAKLERDKNKEETANDNNQG